VYLTFENLSKNLFKSKDAFSCIILFYQNIYSARNEYIRVFATIT